MSSVDIKISECVRSLRMMRGNSRQKYKQLYDWIKSNHLDFVQFSQVMEELYGNRPIAINETREQSRPVQQPVKLKGGLNSPIPRS